MMPFLINPPRRKKRRKHKLFTTAARRAVGLNPRRRKARRKLSTVAQKANTAKRRARTAKRRFSPAQLRAQRAFAAMARARSTSARKARSAAVHSSNPRRKGGTVAKRRIKRRASSRRRRRRPVAANPRRRRRRRVVHHAAVNPRRRRRRHHINARRRHSRRYHRNPGLGGGIKGVGGMLVQGLKDGFVVRLGGGLTKYVSNMVPLGTPGSVTNGAVQLVVGTGLSLAVKKFMGPRAASFFLAGAAADVIGQFIPNTIPVVGPILGAGALNGYGGMGLWPAAVSPARLAAWPRSIAPAPSHMGDYGDNENPDGIFS